VSQVPYKPRNLRGVDQANSMFSEFPTQSRFGGAVAMAALLAGILSGCGGKGYDRIPVAGTVTLNGEPMEEGVITFIPIDGSTGPKARAEISLGEYKFDSATGPVPGRMRVEIDSAESEAEALERDIRGGEKPELHRVVIPPKYNKNSTLTADVSSGGSREFPFALENK
jgi:hypothetical protein